MKLIVLIAAAFLVLPALAAAGQPPDRPATRLTVPEVTFRPPEVLRLDGSPPKFVLVFTREMPTPGWTFNLDDVAFDERAGRIVVKVTENGPQGMVAQVITPTKMQVPLGSPARGRYVVEVWSRRGPTAEHVPVHALIVVLG